MKIKLLHIILLVFVPFLLTAQEFNIPVNYFKALRYHQLQQNEQAKSELDLCTEDPYCTLLKAEILLKEGDFSGSTGLYKSIIDQLPSESSLGLAVVYAEMGFADESLAWLEKHFEYKNPLSYSEILQNNSFTNISSTSEWREFWESPKYSANSEKLTEAAYLIKSEDYFEAISLLENENFGSRNYIKHMLLAEAWMESGNIAAASTNIEISLADNGKNPESLRLKYDIDKQNKNYSACLQTSQLLLKYDSHNPQNLYLRAESGKLIGNLQEALTYVNFYLDCFPDDESAVYLKVQVLYEYQDYRNALIELNKLIDLNSSEKEYFILRGETYFVLESWKFAADDYSMALDIYPFLPDVWYKIGVCQHNQNNSEKACHAWKKAAGMKNRQAAEMLFKYCPE